MFKVMYDYPERLLHCTAADLMSVLGAPTLLHLDGEKEQPLFVSVLLHGNEDVGLLAIQKILKKYQGQKLPRPVSVFIGNVQAAALGMRYLNGQQDYNRVWPGVEVEHDSDEHQMMREIVADIRTRKPFASVDIHNNTGLNPHYACVNLLDDSFLQLATLFSRTVVYFTRPIGVQSLAMSQVCPAVTIECGRAGDMRGVEHAYEYIDALLHLQELPQHAVHHGDIDLFHTVAVVKVPESLSFGFGEVDADIQFPEQLDNFNFSELEPGVLVAKTRSGLTQHLSVVDESGNHIDEKYLSYKDDEIRLHRKVMPSMLTMDETVIRQDCLCYLMERYRLPT